MFSDFLNPLNIPFFCLASVARMIIAMIISLIFAIVVGYISATSKKAERIIIPILDVCQSIPILGFILMVLVVLPKKYIFLEMASIFSIFTSVVWEITFAFWDSVKRFPKSMKDMTNVFKLTPIQKIFYVYIPYSAPSLSINSVVSFGSGMFFLTASESISVLNTEYHLPGIGSYLAIATQKGDMLLITLSFIAILSISAIFFFAIFRPLIKFSIQQLTKEEAHKTKKVIRFTEKIISKLEIISTKIKININDQFWDVIGYILIISTLLLGLWVFKGVTKNELLKLIEFSLISFSRVILSVFIASILLIPTGLIIGLKRIGWGIPVASLLCSLPANVFFPFFAALFSKYNIVLGWGSIILLMLSSQWYILFNSIVGGISFPEHYREVAKIFSVPKITYIKNMIIPFSTPSFVVGTITALGGAWNGTIVAEHIAWKGTIMSTDGIGHFISEMSRSGDVRKTLISIFIMTIFILLTNSILRRIHDKAERKT